MSKKTIKGKLVFSYVYINNSFLAHYRNIVVICAQQVCLLIDKAVKTFKFSIDLKSHFHNKQFWIEYCSCRTFGQLEFFFCFFFLSFHYLSLISQYFCWSHLTHSKMCKRFLYEVTVTSTINYHWQALIHTIAPVGIFQIAQIQYQHK